MLLLDIWLLVLPDFLATCRLDLRWSGGVSHHLLVWSLNLVILTGGGLRYQPMVVEGSNPGWLRVATQGGCRLRPRVVAGINPGWLKVAIQGGCM